MNRVEFCYRRGPLFPAFAFPCVFSASLRPCGGFWLQAGKLNPGVNSPTDCRNRDELFRQLWFQEFSPPNVFNLLKSSGSK